MTRCRHRRVAPRWLLYAIQCRDCGSCWGWSAFAARGYGHWDGKTPPFPPTWLAPGQRKRRREYPEQRRRRVKRERAAAAARHERFVLAERLWLDQLAAPIRTACVVEAADTRVWLDFLVPGFWVTCIGAKIAFSGGARGVIYSVNVRRNELRFESLSGPVAAGESLAFAGSP